MRGPRTVFATSIVAGESRPINDFAASARTLGWESTLLSSRYFLAVLPIRPGAPTTSISASHASSFCAMDSIATFRLHVTRTLSPRGTR